MPQSGFEEGFTTYSEGSLDVLVKEIHAKVPGSIEGYIYDQLKAVLADFFQATLTWRRALGPFTQPAGITTLALNPVDSRTRVVRVLDVKRNGAALPRALADADSRRVTGMTRWYVDPYDVINFVPAPMTDLEDLYVSVALTPRLLSDNVIPQWVLDQHREALLAGTYHRLYQEPGKAYSNIVQAEFFGRRYRSEKARAMGFGNANFDATQPWCFPRHTR